MGEVGEHHEFPVFNGEYALCVGALCTVDEGGKSATCRCQVYEGVSQVFETLDHPAPGDPNPEDILISYFSYVNDEIIESETGAPKVNQKCAGPAQWASCGGARCTKTGEHEALCACDVREATQEQSYCSTSCTEAPGEIRNGSDLPDRSGSITVCHQLGEWTEGVCNLQGTPAPA